MTVVPSIFDHLAHDRAYLRGRGSARICKYSLPKEDADLSQYFNEDVQGGAGEWA